MSDQPTDQPPTDADTFLIRLPGVVIKRPARRGDGWQIMLGRLIGRGATLTAAKAHLTEQILLAVDTLNADPAFALDDDGTTIVIAVDRPWGIDTYHADPTRARLISTSDRHPDGPAADLARVHHYTPLPKRAPTTAPAHPQPNPDPEPEPNPTRPDGTPGHPLSIQLLTIADSSYGPYVALPVGSVLLPDSPYLFTRKTAELIVRDLHRDDAGITATWGDDATLTFTVADPYDGKGGTHTVRPDAHGRYEIGAMWDWEVWDQHVPRTAGQQAFADGAAEYRHTDRTTAYSWPLDDLYRQGRAEAHALTLGRHPAIAATPATPHP